MASATPAAGKRSVELGGALTATGLGGLLLFAGLGFDSPSLAVPGAGLAGLAVVCAAWVVLASPSSLSRAPGPARIVEGAAYPLRIEARGSRLRPPAGELTDGVLERPIALGPRSEISLERPVALEGRGRRTLGPAMLEIRDPLGLVRRRIASADAGELLVLPRIEPVTAATADGGASRVSAVAGLDDGAAAARPEARAIELEVDGLRSYREGTPASRIHWPTVARTGELIERHLIAGADAAPLVVLDASRPASPQALDAAVRATGSLCVHLGERGGAAVLLPGDRRPTEIETDLRSFAQVHVRLALIEESRAMPPAVRALRSGAVFWVTARARPQLPAALRAGAGRRYLVSPTKSPSGRPVFSVAGCDGRLVGARAGRIAAAA